MTSLDLLSSDPTGSGPLPPHGVYPDARRCDTKTLEERFWEKVRKGPGCWEWTGANTGAKSGGYGLFFFEGEIHRASRISLMLAGSPVPKNLCALHKCDNPPCVRPDHLFIGTRSENLKDAYRKGRAHDGGQAERNRMKTHCPQGHPYDEENTYTSREGVRACRACGRIRDRKRTPRNRYSERSVPSAPSSSAGQ